MIKPDQPERDSLFHRILKVLNEMPDSLRQTFMLSHYNELSLDQIARKIGVEQQDAASLLKLANTLFYEKLEPLIPPEGPPTLFRPMADPRARQHRGRRSPAAGESPPAQPGKPPRQTGAGCRLSSFKILGEEFARTREPYSKRDDLNCSHVFRIMVIY